jgi:hypothetical protein
LKSFVDGNLESEFYTFIRPNQEQLKNATIGLLAVLIEPVALSEDRYTHFSQLLVVRSNINA